MYSVTVEVQMLEADILKIVCKDSELYDAYDNLLICGLARQHVQRPASGFVVCTKFIHGLNLMGTEVHALSRLCLSISP